MKILYFYISKKFFKIFVFTTCGLALMVLISEVFYRIGLYMQYKTPIYLIIIHLLTRVPWQTILAFPMATLLALLFSLGDLSQKNEITAMKSAGINMWKIITLFLFIGIFIGVLDLTAREFLIPKTTILHEKVNKQIQNKEFDAVITQFSDFIVSLNDNVRLSARHLDTKKQIMQDIVIEDYDDNFHIKKLLIAQKAVWKNNSWYLLNGIERKFENDLWDEYIFEEYDSQIHLDPQDLIIEDIKFDSMTTKQFKKYINQLQIFGNPAIKARIQLNARYSMIFCHLIVMLIGIPFALGINNKVGRIINFSIALALTFLYWGIQAISQSLGQNNMVSPFMAAWIPNFLSLPLGVYMLSKIRK
ncbi:MAG: LptF/LptG family permease [Elusimicrobiota bacterium]|jgi:lipopolysaccharide export system permease protein|nr:LptF/LptG family permease [Elusimicrobiota bacterium]